MNSDGTLFSICGDAPTYLFAYSYNGSTFAQIADIYLERIPNITIDRNSNIYLANSKDGYMQIYYYDGSSFIYTTQIKNDDSTQVIAIGRDGTIFLANGTNGLKAYKQKWLNLD